MADIDLYINKRIAGRVAKTDEKHLFSYHQDADEALSLTMPLRIESYSHPALHPTFDHKQASVVRSADPGLSPPVLLQRQPGLRPL